MRKNLITILTTLVLLGCPNIMGMKKSKIHQKHLPLSNKKREGVLPLLALNLKTTYDLQYNEHYVVNKNENKQNAYDIHDLKQNTTIKTIETSQYPQLNSDIPSLLGYANNYGFNIYDLRNKKMLYQLTCLPPGLFRKNMNVIDQGRKETRVYNFKTNKEYDLKFENSINNAIASPDCRYLIFPPYHNSHNTYQLHDTKTNSSTSFSVDSNPVFSPNSKRLAFIQYKNNTINIMNLKTQKIIGNIPCTQYVAQLEFSRDSTTLIYLFESDRATIHLYHLTKNSLVTIKPQKELFSFIVDPEIKLIACKTRNKEILIFDAQNGTQITTLSDININLFNYDFTPHNQQIVIYAFALNNDTLQIHNIRNNTVIQTISHIAPQCPESKSWIVFAPNPKKLTIYDYLRNRTASLLFTDPIKKCKIRKNKYGSSLTVITKKQFIQYGETALEKLLPKPIIFTLLLAQIKKPSKFSDITIKFKSET